LKNEVVGSLGFEPRIYRFHQVAPEHRHPGCPVSPSVWWFLLEPVAIPS